MGNILVACGQTVGTWFVNQRITSRQSSTMGARRAAQYMTACAKHVVMRINTPAKYTHLSTTPYIQKTLIEHQFYSVSTEPIIIRTNEIKER